MRARLRSYGETSTRTRSPGRMRIRKRRIFPATWPSTSWPLSSCTRNMAFGRASTTSPSNSTFSSLDKALKHPHVRGLWALRALPELVGHLRPFGERPEATPGDRREMDERVLAAVIGGDEPEALLVAEPLHDTGSHPTALLVPACRGGKFYQPEGPLSAVVGRGLRAAGGRLGSGRGLRLRLVGAGIVRLAVVVVGGRVLVAGVRRGLVGLGVARRGLRIVGLVLGTRVLVL